MSDAERTLPPVNPIHYSRSRHFLSGHDGEVRFWPPELADVTVDADSFMFRNRLFEDFERVNRDRAGILKGEYVATADGLFLIDRTGNCISVNFPHESALVAQRAFLAANAWEFWDLRKQLLEQWDRVPLVEHGTIWSHIYHNNYYHFTFEFLQKARLTKQFELSRIVMPKLIPVLRFQQDLLAMAVGGTPLILQDGPVRMVDPVVADGWQSYEALGWLRRTTGLTASPGRKRYYIRRTPNASRAANNVCESPEFHAFLNRHGFEAIDFGNGERPIAEQVNLVKDAAVILAPHGAGMTNIAYLNPPLTIIECFSPRVLSASFMQIAICLGFRYFALISEQEDADKRIVLDVGKLEAIMERCGR